MIAVPWLRSIRHYSSWTALLTFGGDYPLNRRRKSIGGPAGALMRQWAEDGVPAIDVPLNVYREELPRCVSSPISLTGLLKCGHFNAGMTLGTEERRYRYYKCTTRTN